MTDTRPESDSAIPTGRGGGKAFSSRLQAFHQELSRYREPDQVLRALLRAMVDHLNPDGGCVLCVTASGSYWPVVHHKLNFLDSPDLWPLSHTVLRRVMSSGNAILATDAGADPVLGASPSIMKLGIKTVVCLPLGASPVQALVYLDKRGKGQAFSEEDFKLATALSLLAAMKLGRYPEESDKLPSTPLTVEEPWRTQARLKAMGIVGCSRALMDAFDALGRYARAGARVLLRGETGTGKELFAKAYHQLSDRRGGPFVPVAVPGLNPSLAEAELFGSVEGGFTDARSAEGFLESAKRGVLFLDEVGDIDPSLQVKLLRFLDSGEVYRVGERRPRLVDALVVSATNLPLEELVTEKRFRPELLARLGHEVRIPPLRERLEDIPALVEHFVQQFHRGPGRKTFSSESLYLLQQHRWELNIRELQKVVEEAGCMVDRELIRPEDLPPYLQLRGAAPAPAGESARDEASAVPRPLREVIDEVEKAHIQQALEYTKGNRRMATRVLQISSETLYKRLEKFGLD